MEQSLGQGRDEHVEGRSASCRLAHYRHLIGVSSKRRDILLHPTETLDHVLHPIVRAHSLISRVKEAKWPESVLHRDKDDLVRQKFVCPVASGATQSKATSVDEEDNREQPSITATLSSGVDVQVETVFISFREVCQDLGAGFRISIRFVDSITPTFIWLWSLLKG